MKHLKWIWIDNRVDVPAWVTRYIGKIAVEWSDLEWQFEDAIRLLMETHIRQARIAVTGMNMKSRILVATNFLQSHVYYGTLSTTYLDRITKIGKAISKLESERNKVIHGLWGKKNKTWYLLRNSSTRTVQELPEIKKFARAVLPQFEIMEPIKLQEILERITLQRIRMIELCHDLECALPPSPHKSPRRLRQQRPGTIRLTYHAPFVRMAVS